MNKKFIILTVILGLFSFGGTFAFVWFTKKPEQTNPVDVEISQTPMQSDTELAAASKKPPNLEPTTKYLTEQPNM